MAANTWNNSQANNDGNDPLNWSLGWVPKAGDTMRFDGGVSNADCVFTADIAPDSCETSSYTGTVKISTTNGTYSFTMPSGTYTFGGLEWESLGTGTLTVDAGTNNPTITITGDLTIDIDSTGGVVLDASSNAIALQGDLIDEITGGGTFTADSQDLTLSGTANQNIDGCGGTWDTVQIAKNSGTATLTDTLTCATLVHTKGGLDLNGQTLTASGTVAVTSVLGGVTIGDLTGSTINCNEFSDSGIDLIGAGTWYLNCTTSGTIVNATITNCDASGGVEIDATDNCVDGGGNDNIDFGAVPLASWEIAAWNTPFEAGAWR
jgi:hypothetical protein